MTASKAKRSHRLRIALLVLLVGAEAAIVARYVWPLSAARWRAPDDQLGARGGYASPVPRPTSWAQPMLADGLTNLHKVSADLYRGARPSAEGMRQLKDLGVKTVINLELFHSDRDELKGTGLGYVHIRFNAAHAETDELAEFLRVVSDANLAPFFVHCQYGSDRTGTVCAVYRIAVQGWGKPAALDEMVNGGYGFHSEWQNLLQFVDKLDANALKRQAGLAK